MNSKKRFSHKELNRHHHQIMTWNWNSGINVVCNSTFLMLRYAFFFCSFLECERLFSVPPLNLVTLNVFYCVTIKWLCSIIWIVAMHVIYNTALSMVVALEFLEKGHWHFRRWLLRSSSPCLAVVEIKIYYVCRYIHTFDLREGFMYFHRSHKQWGNILTPDRMYFELI